MRRPQSPCGAFSCAGGYNWAMDENPYKAPDDSTSTPIPKSPRRLSPLWPLLLLLPLLDLVSVAVGIRYQRTAALAVFLFVILLMVRAMRGRAK